jgi:hypothetical protein
MARHIICIMGHSGSGKDTAAGFILEYLYGAGYDARNCKASAAMKRMLEYAYQLGEGDLDDRGVRSGQVWNDRPDTYLDLMVKSFEHMRSIDSRIMFPRWLEQIEGCEVAVLTDVRSPEEAEVVIKMQTAGVNIYLVDILSDYGQPLPSDRHLRDNLIDVYDHIPDDRATTVSNRSTIEDFKANSLQAVSAWFPDKAIAMDLDPLVALCEGDRLDVTGLGWGNADDGSETVLHGGTWDFEPMYED